MARPVGITIIATLCFLVAAWGIWGVAHLIIAGGLMELLLPQQHHAASANQAELAAILTLVLIASIALYAIAGLGLWKLRSWGRVLTIVLVALGAADDLLRQLLAARSGPTGILKTVVTLVLYAITAWYLFKPGIKAAFISGKERGREEGG